MKILKHLALIALVGCGQSMVAMDPADVAERVNNLHGIVNQEHGWIHITVNGTVQPLIMPAAYLGAMDDLQRLQAENPQGYQDFIDLNRVTMNGDLVDTNSAYHPVQIPPSIQNPDAYPYLSSAHPFMFLDKLTVKHIVENNIVNVEELFGDIKNAAKQ